MHLQAYGRLRRTAAQRLSYPEQNVSAVAVELTRDELARIGGDLPKAGDRYNEAGMASVNL